MDSLEEKSLTMEQLSPLQSTDVSLPKISVDNTKKMYSLHFRQNISSQTCIWKHWINGLLRPWDFSIDCHELCVCHFWFTVCADLLGLGDVFSAILMLKSGKILFFFSIGCRMEDSTFYADEQANSFMMSSFNLWRNEVWRLLFYLQHMMVLNVIA